MKSNLILLLVLFIMLTVGVAHAAEHEIGIGASYADAYDSFKRGYAFDLYYDYLPERVFGIRMAVGGFYATKETDTRSTYWEDFYLSRESLAEKPDDDFLFLYLEESLMFRLSGGRIEPYTGLGFSFFLIDHEYDQYGREKTDNSLGMNIRAGLKYPITQKFLTFIEAKYIYSGEGDNNNDDARYPNISVESSLDIGSSKIHNIYLNRLAIRAGLSFRLYSENQNNYIYSIWYYSVDWLR